MIKLVGGAYRHGKCVASYGRSEDNTSGTGRFARAQGSYLHPAKAGRAERLLYTAESQDATSTTCFNAGFAFVPTSPLLMLAKLRWFASPCHNGSPSQLHEATAGQ